MTHVRGEVTAMLEYVAAMPEGFATENETDDWFKFRVKRIRTPFSRQILSKK